jgi:sugar phosphate isomerase/epimerase
VTPSDLYVSTNSFETRDLAEILGICERYGIDGLELSTLARWDPALLGSTSYPSRFLVHNYFAPPDPPFVLNLASQDAGILERSRALCRAAIDLSATLGSPVYAAHGGYTADVSPDLLGRPERLASLHADDFADRDDAYATLVESAQALGAYGREQGVRFLVENHVLANRAGAVGRQLLLMVGPDDLTCLARDVDDGLGVLVDVGHLKVSAATLGVDVHEALDALGPFTSALHLSDNDAVVDDHRPFGDDAWFLPRLRDFPDACLTVELMAVPVEGILAVRDTVERWR